MRMYSASLIVAFAAAGAAVMTADRAAPRCDGITLAQAQEIVDVHNAWRKRTGVVALRWAADLAVRAQARAEALSAHGCVIAHGPLPADIGENLYYLSPLRYTGGRPAELFVLSASEVVDAWGAESADYSAERDTCAPNRQCGHYTQIVWATTREVGCGMSVCPTLGQVWVCNYRPSGNVRIFRWPV